jgi:hypothetical protein
MRALAYLAIATFFSISALVSLRKPWFGFIYGFPGGDKLAHFVGPGLLGASTLDRLRHAAYRLVLDGKSYRTPRGDNQPENTTVEKVPKTTK